MANYEDREDDRDPEPVKESEAERVSGDEAREIENDPAHEPEEQALRDIKGG